MDTGFEPKILICVECSQEFVFTVNAQEYFAEKGFTEDPKRCKHCYMRHKRDKRNTHIMAARVEADSMPSEHHGN